MRHLPVVLLAFVLGACNLGNVTVTEIPTPTELIPDGPPEISINSPASGDEFVVNEQILVSVTATDQAGVTRVQLLANDQIVKSVSSESLSGETTFSAVLDYTPRVQGAVVLQAIAYRGATASDPDEIQVEIRNSQTQVTSTPVQGSGIPQIPNDGVCRALVNVGGLNFREGPSTDDDIIRVLTSGTLAPITGRLGDNSWWELNNNGTVGWVAAEFTTAYGNCLSVPVRQITQPTQVPTDTPAPTLTPIPDDDDGGSTSGTPNLLVTNIVGETEVDVDSTETYTITITNAGNAASGQFLSVVEVDDTEYDLAAVSNLDRGESIALEVDVEFADAGEVELIVNVDIEDDVDEVSEFDNRATLEITVSE